MVAADIAILRTCLLLVFDVIFKEFDRRAVGAFQHPKFVYLRPASTPGSVPSNHRPTSTARLRTRPCSRSPPRKIAWPPRDRGRLCRHDQHPPIQAIPSFHPLLLAGRTGGGACRSMHPARSGLKLFHSLSTAPRANGRATGIMRISSWRRLKRHFKAYLPELPSFRQRAARVPWSSG